MTQEKYWWGAELRHIGLQCQCGDVCPGVQKWMPQHPSFSQDTETRPTQLVSEAQTLFSSLPRLSAKCQSPCTVGPSPSVFSKIESEAELSLPHILQCRINNV
jgi:hypothetical protein